MAKLRIGQRVNIKKRITPCKIGTITGIEIRYIVKQDDGLAFRFDERALEANNER